MNFFPLFLIISWYFLFISLVIWEQAKWETEEEVEREWEHFRESQTGFVSVLIVWVGSIGRISSI